jgi:hypothetical protein
VCFEAELRTVLASIHIYFLSPERSGLSTAVR